MSEFIVKHKKFLILFILFMILFWLITFQVKAGRFTFMEKPVLAVSGFFERVITSPFRFAESAAKGYIFLIHTQRENGRLKEETAQLKLENSITNELIIENERLRELLGFRKLHPPTSVMAQVIAKESSPSSRTVTINKGADDGIQKDMAVIAPTGIVGRVQAVLSGTAKVILLTDPGSTLAVRVQRNREEGLLEGKIITCALKYVSYYADIQEGDLLVTSGLDGIYPKGLPVATVTKVTRHEASAFQTVVAEPAVRLSRLEEALVLLK
ncbi:MAG TPA: rod shape-determining protein MreC [Nitrospirota bacterium]|nr:rod shape-determining protein MreC [Nitrospirota bacterium]